MLEQEICIDSYKILLCDRNRHHGVVVACYVRNDLIPYLPLPVKLKTFSFKFYYLTQNQ